MSAYRIQPVFVSVNSKPGDFMTGLLFCVAYPVTQMLIFSSVQINPQLWQVPQETVVETSAMPRD